MVVGMSVSDDSFGKILADYVSRLRKTAGTKPQTATIRQDPLVVSIVRFGRQSVRAFRVDAALEIFTVHQTPVRILHPQWLWCWICRHLLLRHHTHHRHLLRRALHDRRLVPPLLRCSPRQQGDPWIHVVQTTADLLAQMGCVARLMGRITPTFGFGTQLTCC